RVLFRSGSLPQTREFLARVVTRGDSRIALDVLNPTRELPFANAVKLPAVGDYVLVRADDGQARAVASVAEAGSSRAELVEIFTRYQLTPAFSDRVQAEVAHFLQNPGIDDPGLTNLTHLPFVTIDGETSLDLDQAAYVERDVHGYVVYYALADASYYVQPGTALWEEAMRRAASYYLPAIMVPMLPRQLSEGLVSLNPDVERRALVLRTRLHADGSLRQTSQAAATDALRARIRSRAKLSFGGVQA